MDQLTDDDIIQLMEAEDELTRAGGLKRVYPSEKARDYLPYFDFPYYYNVLLALWEEKYHDDRLAGINRLRNQMLQKDKIREYYDNLKTQFETNSRHLRSFNQNDS